MALKVRYETVDPRTLTLLDVNARFMRKETYDQLVANLRRDGVLTSVPLVWDEPGSGRRIVLSGNHRVQAAIEAELPEITIIVVEQDLTRDEQIALQLSHNAIVGEDDPATLKQLYDELADVDLRAYSGLDDATLGLLADVSPEGLSEANLDFCTVQLVFLPAERDAAKAAFDAARKITAADERWLAAYADYLPTLDALSTVSAAHNVGNVATALGLILSRFEQALEEQRDGAWYDPASQEATAPGTQRVPIESIVETRTIPATAGALVARAVEKAVNAGDVPSAQRWKAFEIWAQDYLRKDKV